MKQKWLLALVLILSACRSQVTPTPISTLEVHPELKNIPTYSENTSWIRELPQGNIPKDLELYTYTANVYKMEVLVTFYEENMPSYGWELFYKAESEFKGIRGTTLMFSKSKIIAELEITDWTTTIKLVSVKFYSSP